METRTDAGSLQSAGAEEEHPHRQRDAGTMVYISATAE